MLANQLCSGTVDETDLVPMVQIASQGDIVQTPPNCLLIQARTDKGQMIIMGKWSFHKTQPAMIIGPLLQTKKIGRLRKLLTSSC